LSAILSSNGWKRPPIPGSPASTPLRKPERPPRKPRKSQVTPWRATGAVPNSPPPRRGWRKASARKSTTPSTGARPQSAAEQNKLEALGLSDTAWSGSGGGETSGEASNIEAYIAEQTTLADHLSEQLAVATADPFDRMIGAAIIDSIDEAGYLRESAAEIGERLNAAPERVEKVVRLVQTFDPTGVGARDLAECLAIQLRELDRFDPAMAAMVANLPLVARRDLAALRKICGVDDEDLIDMFAEIRRLDPSPDAPSAAASSSRWRPT